VRNTGVVRTYGQYCPIARGIEIFAERWTPLIIRNLYPGCGNLNGSEVLSRGTRSVVVAAFLVMAVSRFVPIGPVQFYVQGVAGILALWPISYHIWKHATARDLRQAQPMPAV